MKIGDLITTYHSGFHRLVRVSGDVCYYTQEFTSDCKPKKSKERACSIEYCKLAKDFIEQELVKLNKKQQTLENFLRYVDKQQHK